MTEEQKFFVTRRRRIILWVSFVSPVSQSFVVIQSCMEIAFLLPLCPFVSGDSVHFPFTLRDTIGRSFALSAAVAAAAICTARASKDIWGTFTYDVRVRFLPPPSLCPTKCMFCLSANLGYFLTPLTSYVEAPCLGPSGGGVGMDKYRREGANGLVVYDATPAAAAPDHDLALCLGSSARCPPLATLALSLSLSLLTEVEQTKI